MFCPKCGNEYEASFKFCPNCGEAKQVVVQQSEITPPQPVPPPPPPAPPPGGYYPQQYPPTPAPKKSRKGIGCGGALLVLILLVAVIVIISSVSKKETPTTTPAQTTTQLSQTTSAQPPSTEAQLKSAVGSGLGTVTYDPATQTATVTKTVPDPFGTVEVVRDAYKTFVQFGQKAIKVPGIAALCIVYVVPFTDQYGKKANDTAVRLVMPTSEFVKYDWKALEYQPISDKLQASCSEYYTHPSFGYMSPDKLFLPGI